MTLERPTLTIEETADGGDAALIPREGLALVLAWSKDEPERVGELVLAPAGFVGARARLGRAPAAPNEPIPRAELVQQRPGQAIPTGPLRCPHLSRDQLELTGLERGGLHVANLGKCPLLVNGAPAERVKVRPGDVLELRGLALFYCVPRPFVLPAPPPGTAAWPGFRFGQADPFGIVGESPAAWELRQRIAFVAPRQAHVLVRGPSGSGKELVAQAIHALSPRAGARLVARNAATIPESLVDAELFGNARSYPNPGMPERPGLIGESDGSTLFLDEFGELPVAVQAHLLRVLDDGEYHRLGESRARRCDLRLVAATNRPVEALKDDVLARLRLRVEVPELGARREDIPLLVRHLLGRIARADHGIAARFFPGGDPGAVPRLSPALLTVLLRREWRTQVRELEAALWEAMAGPGDTLEVPPDWQDEGPADDAPRVDALAIPPERIQEVLDRHGGRQSEAWQELGLSSRHVLARLVKRHGLRVGRE